ncbi:HAD-IA family hydrolase [Streptomyces sp. NPDC001544]|uniref:HAD-IA family hydrolase n=1 Tax=Streptomyces sp. NPDC001544 TaxID=3364584 RepID=UPI00367F4420
MNGDEPVLCALTALIANRRAGAPRSPYVVGVTGVDTAGKSRMAERLHTLLRTAGTPATVVHVDDFHRPRAERYDPALPAPRQYYERSIDFARLEAEILVPLRAEGRLHRTVAVLDPASDEWTTVRHDIGPGSVVILEGVFLYRAETRPYVDLFVHLHVDEDTVLERARQRDVPGQGEEVMAKYAGKYLPAQRAYLARHRPQTLADVIIDNAHWQRPVVRTWPGGPRAVLFDLWKTLVPLPEELKRRTFEATAEALGQRPEDLADVWKRTRDVRETRPFAAYLDRLRDQVAGTWSPAQAERAAATRRLLHGQAFAAPLPGAVEAVTTARRLGLRTALVSNCTSDVREMVRDSPFAGLFDELVLSAEAGVMKPDPELFLAAADRLGVPPSACVFVGDGTDGELSGAAAAGMTAVLVECGEPRSWTGPRIAALPDLTDLVVTVLAKG